MNEAVGEFKDKRLGFLGFGGSEGNWFLEWTLRADKNVRPTSERQKTTGNGVPLPMPPDFFRTGLIK
jgi:hypothetical protein